MYLPYKFGLKGYFSLCALIIVFIPILDVYWMQRIMSMPEWNGIPDIDIVFYMGVLFRIGLLLIASSIVAVAVFFLKSRRSNET